MEIYSDAQTFGLKSASTTAVSNSSLAISWLEATFPELNQQGKEITHTSAVKARPYVLIDASLSLQGPLRKIFHGEEVSGFHGAEGDGRAASFIYNSVGKDSILVIAWSGGHLQIDALADEIQPIWRAGYPPRISFDSHDHILGFAMICESNADQLSIVRLDQPDENSDWSGHPPPLLRLAIVDLALPRSNDGQAESVSSSLLCGFVVLSDSFGYSWIAAVMSTRECIVFEMKTWNVLLPRLMDTEINPAKPEEAAERITPDIISRELLAGPKVVIVPQGSNLRSVTADSIEGRSALHQYFKLFHENYVEYAHKVYFELKHHGPHLKKIIDNMHARLHDAQQKLLNVEEKQPKLDERIRRVVERHEYLEEHLHKLRRLPGIHKKPLTRAEREFKAELDRFTGIELDALHSSIEALKGRLRRYTQSLQGEVRKYQRTPTRKKNLAQDAQLDQLKDSLEKLSLLNSENAKKVKMVESSLKSLEDETA